jgi:DNA polymerase III epsilon subunit-like protein
MAFDTETTGIPESKDGLFYNPREVARYDSSRVVQVAWVMIKGADKILAKHSHVIKPEGFSIPEDSVRIHGIDDARAQSEGIRFEDIAVAFLRDLRTADVLVAHNLKFDLCVMMSECHRRCLTELKVAMYRAPRHDTMTDPIWYEIRGTLTKSTPKLVELHKALFGQDYEQRHDALDDALLLAKCFMRILRLKQSSEYRAKLRSMKN